MGADSTILVLSLTTPPLTGTFRSARTKTRLPLSGISSASCTIVFLAATAVEAWNDLDSPSGQKAALLPVMRTKLYMMLKEAPETQTKTC